MILNTADSAESRLPVRPEVRDSLRDKIRSKQARVGIIGLGYVGLPLAVEFARSGFAVTGIDLDPGKVAQINQGISHIADVPSAEVASFVEQKRLRASEDHRVLGEMDVVNICVPTPLHKTKDPDLSFIAAAVAQIQMHLHPGMLIILESTTYPGTTEEVILPRLVPG